MRVKTGQRPAPSARTDTEQALESPLQAGKNRNGTSYLMHRGIAHRSCVFAMALARPFWKGYLKLSLVSCPIAMFPASSSSERVSFRQINKSTGNRLKQQLVDSVTGDVVDSGQKGRGYEIGRNQCVPAWDRGCLLRAPLSPSAACLSPRGPW